MFQFELTSVTQPWIADGWSGSGTTILSLATSLSSRNDKFLLEVRSACLGGVCWGCIMEWWEWGWRVPTRSEVMWIIPVFTRCPIPGWPKTDDDIGGVHFIPTEPGSPFEWSIWAHSGLHTSEAEELLFSSSAQLASLSVGDPREVGVIPLSLMSVDSEVRAVVGRIDLSRSRFLSEDFTFPVCDGGCCWWRLCDGMWDDGKSVLLLEEVITFITTGSTIPPPPPPGPNEPFTSETGLIVCSLWLWRCSFLWVKLAEVDVCRWYLLEEEKFPLPPPLAPLLEEWVGPYLSREQVLPVGLNPSQEEEGVIPCSVRRAAGKLHVEDLRVIYPEKGMSRNPTNWHNLRVKDSNEVKRCVLLNWLKIDCGQTQPASTHLPFMDSNLLGFYLTQLHVHTQHPG